MKNCSVPGHVYDLVSLDGNHEQELRFVNRTTGNFSGTTCQSVLRCLYDRVLFMHKQIPHVVNPIILFLLSLIVWLFEFRAALRRSYVYKHTPYQAITGKMCLVCGHTFCKKHNGEDVKDFRFMTTKSTANLCGPRRRSQNEQRDDERGSA